MTYDRMIGGAGAVATEGAEGNHKQGVSSMSRFTVTALGIAAATTLGTGAAFSPAANADRSPTGSAFSSVQSSSLNQTAQCLVDDGNQLPSSEPPESPEFATVKINLSGLNGGNGKLRQIPISMTFTDDEADTASVTVLSISGDPADSSGVGNSASGPADGTEINTALMLRATPGNTYTVTVQCADGGTTPQTQNQVSFQVTVP
jgi:hypothetical protein